MSLMWKHLSTCQFFNPKFFSHDLIIALLFLVYSLNVTVYFVFYVQLCMIIWTELCTAKSLCFVHDWELYVLMYFAASAYYTIKIVCPIRNDLQGKR